VRLFYGNEYRFFAAFKVSPAVRSVNGRIIQRRIVLPTGF